MKIFSATWIAGAEDEDADNAEELEEDLQQPNESKIHEYKKIMWF